MKYRFPVLGDMSRKRAGSFAPDCTSTREDDIHGVDQSGSRAYADWIPAAPVGVTSGAIFQGKSSTALKPPPLGDGRSPHRGATYTCKRSRRLLTAKSTPPRDPYAPCAPYAPCHSTARTTARPFNPLLNLIGHRDHRGDRATGRTSSALWPQHRRFARYAKPCHGVLPGPGTRRAFPGAPRAMIYQTRATSGV